MVEIIIIKMNDQINSEMIPKKYHTIIQKLTFCGENIANQPSINESNPTLPGSKVKEVMQLYLIFTPVKSRKLIYFQNYSKKSQSYIN